MRIKFPLLILFLFSFNSADAFDGWDNFTGSDSNYSKKLLTLNLGANYINFQNEYSPNSSEVLVIISENPKNDYYFKILCETFCKDLSLMEYVTNRFYYDSQYHYEKENIRYYLRNRGQMAKWPSLFWEPREIELEIEKSAYTKKNLLISGHQMVFLTQANMHKGYDRLIIISPDISVLTMEKNSLENKEILWVGGQLESSRLNSLKDKFGGKVLTYPRSSIGKNLLMRNTQVLNDILSWIKKVG